MYQSGFETLKGRNSAFIRQNRRFLERFLHLSPSGKFEGAKNQMGCRAPTEGPLVI